MLLNKQDLTVWVPAHLIGQVSKAPFIPELLWQAGALKHLPLQPCESNHTHDPFNLRTGSTGLTPGQRYLRVTHELTYTISSAALWWFISESHLKCLLERKVLKYTPPKKNNKKTHLSLSVPSLIGRTGKKNTRVSARRTDSPLCLGVFKRQAHNEHTDPTANDTAPPFPQVQLQYLLLPERPVWPAALPSAHVRGNCIETKDAYTVTKPTRNRLVSVTNKSSW